jgi:hypothetical protein
MDVLESALRPTLDDAQKKALIDGMALAIPSLRSKWRNSLSYQEPQGSLGAHLVSVFCAGEKIEKREAVSLVRKVIMNASDPAKLVLGLCLTNNEVQEFYDKILNPARSLDSTVDNFLFTVGVLADQKIKTMDEAKGWLLSRLQESNAFGQIIQTFVIGA